MQRTKWFERTFPPIADNGLLPGIIERLDGTAARLRGKMTRLEGHLVRPENGSWSIKKEVGHLLDLEPLWHERALQIMRGEGQLLAADLTNRRTHDTDHDAADLADLIDHFDAAREKLVAVLSQASDADLEKSALHPRLGTPMRVIDLAFFVAEHDDHHLAQITHLARA